MTQQTVREKLDLLEAGWAAMTGTIIMACVDKYSRKEKLKYSLAKKVKEDVEPLLKQAEIAGAKRLAEEVKKREKGMEVVVADLEPEEAFSLGKNATLTTVDEALSVIKEENERI